MSFSAISHVTERCQHLCHTFIFHLSAQTNNIIILQGERKIGRASSRLYSVYIIFSMDAFRCTKKNFSVALMLNAFELNSNILLMLHLQLWFTFLVRRKSIFETRKLENNNDKQFGVISRKKNFLLIGVKPFVNLWDDDDMERKQKSQISAQLLWRNW